MWSGRAIRWIASWIARRSRPSRTLWQGPPGHGQPPGRSNRTSGRTASTLGWRSNTQTPTSLNRLAASPARALDALAGLAAKQSGYLRRERRRACLRRLLPFLQLLAEPGVGLLRLFEADDAIAVRVDARKVL